MEKRALNLTRRKFTKEFKLAAVRRLETGASAAEVARACEVNANVLHRWRREFRDGVETAFPGLGRQHQSEENRIAELEQTIGQQTMEIAFLKRVLQRTEEARKLQAMGVVGPSTSKSSANKRKLDFNEASVCRHVKSFLAYITRPGRTCHWPKTRPHRGPCNRRNWKPSNLRAGAAVPVPHCNEATGRAITSGAGIFRALGGTSGPYPAVAACTGCVLP